MLTISILTTRMETDADYKDRDKDVDCKIRDKDADYNDGDKILTARTETRS